MDNSELNVDLIRKTQMPPATDEVTRKVEKPDIKDMKVEPSDNKQDANKDVKDEKTEGAEVQFKAQELVNEYLQKFEGDLNAFLSTCSSEEETMERINWLSDILHIIDGDKLKELKTKSEVKDEQNKKEEVK